VLAKEGIVASDLYRVRGPMTSKKISLSGLSPNNLKTARASLEVWCSPQTFFKKIEELAKTITTEELFNAPQLGFVLDAMILAQFAIKLEGAQKVRLATGGEKYPDGFVETPTGNLGIEVTEVDREARRRGDEYKSGAAPRDSADDSEEKAKVISTELERVIQKKVNKHYRPKPTLVVYLNLVDSGTPESEMLTIIEDAKHRHASSFKGIYVLWNGKLI
jgi:hypothetical protein